VSYNRPGRARPRRQHPSRRRAGFTLVEILTAVAIIAILVSMAFLGFKYASSAPKKNVTDTALHNVAGMLVEFEGKGGRMKDLLAPYMDNTDPTKPKAMPVPVTFEVLDPESLHLAPLAPPAPNTPRPPFGSKYYEIYVTAYEIMPRLRAIPENRAVLDALPVDNIYPRRWSATRTFQKDERVQSGNGFYVCVQTYTASTGSQPPELDTGHWRQDAPNLLVLDAWGCPIVFVPPAGAVEMYQGGTVSDPSQPLPAGTVKRVVGGATPVTAPRQSPDRKAYFMSAGPDRNFANGDDNVYSFDSK
jgi:prepilin-type N-terminal cleavage/methylation domain-containing protein